MGSRGTDSTRSYAGARRVRTLAVVVDVYGLLVAVSAVVAGGLLATYRRIEVTTFATDGSVASSDTTFPYVLAGIGVAVGGLVVATLLLLFGETARLRAQLVLDGVVPAAGRSAAPAPTSAASASSWEADAHAVTVMATGGRGQRGPTRSTGVPPRRRVLILTDQEKAQLAKYPPPNAAEGWYPDPLDASSLRRWNGRQWTGEQQPIALPPR